MAISPMMQQYCRIKEEYTDAFLFFRVGDFYELYFDDAKAASEELGIYLTGRDCGLEERVAMAGVPAHSVEPYLARLVQKGYKVAVCDQIGAADEMQRGGLFKREVVRVVTPGTVMDSELLDEEKNNYIACVHYDGNTVGVSWSDISTGEFNHSFIDAPIAVALGELLTRINPSEIICNEQMLEASVSLSIVKYGMVCAFTLYKEPAFEYEFALKSAKSQFSQDSLKQLIRYRNCVSSAGALVEYLRETQKRTLGHIHHSATVQASERMYIDSNARRALELTENTQDCSKRGSLLWLIDKTSTKPGARRLRKILLEPFLDEAVIEARLDGVQELQNDRVRDKITARLKNIIDIERTVGKLSYGSMAPKEALRMCQSLAEIPHLKAALAACECVLLKELCERLTDYPSVYNKVIAAISEKAPQIVREGGVFNSGYDAELDEYRNLKNNTASVIANLESAERAETKLKNLKITYSRNSGYCIELPKSQSDQVPFRYIRRATLKNSERYVTEELKLLEEKIIGAHEQALNREEVLYKELVEGLRQYIEPFLELSHTVAELDTVVSHAQVSKENRFIRPVIGGETIAVSEGRHCVVEKLLKDEAFIPNDTLLDGDENQIMLITGPNMAGKSVYMRQVAIIAILAHTGCFVPAKKAQIPIIDKIFTRVGASDDLLTGRSTFMVEMSEVSEILNTMSDRSLLILDEIGRGTSTYDGLSIAWSILEYLSANTSAKVLFSTHYHELTELENVLKGLKNYKLTLREAGGSIVFLRKLLRGCANRSFGIEVASLAGLPSSIVARAKELLIQLEGADIGRQAKMASNHQISIFNSGASNEIQAILKELDVDSISPRHALEILSDLKEKAEKK